MFQAACAALTFWTAVRGVKGGLRTDIACFSFDWKGEDEKGAGVLRRACGMWGCGWKLVG